MKILKIVKNIEPILNVTKNVIKESDNFNNYYIHEDNNLYKNQLPLLIRNSRIREVMSLKKLKRQDLVNITEANDEREEQKETINPLISLSNIRNPHIRSKKLPPLCPFFSQKGELLPEVVFSSNINSRNNIKTEGSYDINISFSSNSLGKYSTRKLSGFKSPTKLKKIDHSNFFKILEINFDEFQKEILNEPKYNLLKYDNVDIFGHKDFYQELIKGLVEEILILTGDEFDKSKIEENQEIKKEKMFELGKNKKQILLTLNSLKITIIELKGTSTDDNNDKSYTKDNICFEYSLPFNLLPLFYYKGFEKFKLFIFSFFHYNEETQKFEINENISKIINILLNNCADVKFKKNNEDEYNDEELNILQPVDNNKRTMNLNSSKIEKSSKKNLSSIKPQPFSKSMNFGMALLQNTLFAGTNIDIVSKKKLKKSKYDLYPKEKQNEDFLNYSNFQFFWNISDKIFCINIEMPLIEFSVPFYNIIVKQYIDYELLFYLYKINFDSWDFYVIKYLSSYKKFRILFSQLTAIKPKKNINMFLDKYKNRYFEKTDTKIINIITSKLLAEKKVVVEKRKKTKRSTNLRKIKLNSINEKNEGSNIDKQEEENKEKEKDIKDININKIEEENNEESKIKEEEKKKNTKPTALPTEETQITEQPVLTTNSTEQPSKIIKLTDNQLEINSILEQKCFIALVTLTDTEKYISNQYTIHFNYFHFTKFKSMEKYMKKTSFLLKFINIHYDKTTISFDYDALNAFDENNWMNEIEKYKLNYESEIQTENNKIINEEDKNGPPVVINKNKVEYPGAKKGTTIIIEIKPPILLLRRLNNDGTIFTKTTEIFEEEENKLSLNEGNNIYSLTKNMFEISIYHKKKEIDEQNTKDLANNILMYAFKRRFNKGN